MDLEEHLRSKSSRVPSIKGLSIRFLKTYLQPITSSFLGVFSEKNIPPRLSRKQNGTMIILLGKSAQEVGHYVTLILSPQYVLYIDTFGLPCLSSSIRTFIARSKRDLFFNTKQIQAVTSKYCGIYSILWVLLFDEKNKRVKSVKFQAPHLNDDLCRMYIIKIINKNALYSSAFISHFFYIEKE